MVTCVQYLLLVLPGQPADQERNQCAYSGQSLVLPGKSGVREKMQHLADKEAETCHALDNCSRTTAMVAKGNRCPTLAEAFLS